jgi:phage-related protein
MMKVAFYKLSSGRNPVTSFIDGLSKEDQAKFVRVIEGIETQGFQCPGVKFKRLIGKLWEIKFGGEGGSYRVAYVVIEGPLMLWIHAFKKTSQKTPQKELDIALKRMKEILP